MTPEQVRSMALELYKKGDYEKARELLILLLDVGFDVLSTRLHLARIALMTDNVSEADKQVSEAWAQRKEAKPYVVARLLWMQALNAQMDNADAASIFGQLKTVLQADDAFMEWKMQPVLDHLNPRLSAEALALLSALVDALGSREKLPHLDRFPAWREVAPQPLE